MSTTTGSVGVVTAQGSYAGSVSRFVAYVIDVAVSAGIFALGLAATSFAAQVVTGHSIHFNRSQPIVIAIYVLWEFFYFGYSWAVGGRTVGMAVLGVRVVRTDGGVLDPWHGVLRSLVFPLSFLLFGLGFLGILVQREHRALHDLIAGSAVIYSWDARAARLRFLARTAEAGGQGAASPAATESGAAPAATVPASAAAGAGTAAAAEPGDVPTAEAAGGPDNAPAAEQAGHEAYWPFAAGDAPPAGRDEA